MTVRVFSGDAAKWTGLLSVLVAARGDDADAVPARFEVERSRAYRDRLVLKLAGVDDPTAATALKGRWILAPGGDVPALPPGTFYVERLVGLGVQDEAGHEIGRVEDVMPTGGTDVLVIRGMRGEEILLPLAAAIVLEVREPDGPIVVRPTDGLLPGTSGGEGAC